VQPDKDAAVAAKRLERMVRARANLVMDEPFFGMLALRLKLVEDPSCSTVWTDSVSFGFNPGYVDSLADVELRGIIGKSVMHIAAGHPWRQDSRESGQWQKACTAAIYPLLVNSGMRLPAGVPHDQQYDGLSAEAIYEKLQVTPPSGSKPAPSKGGDKDTPASAPGDGDEGSGGDDSKDDGEAPDSSAPAPGKGPGGGEGEDDSEGDGKGGSGPNPESKPAPAPIPGEVRPAPEDENHEAEWKMAMDTAVRMQGDLAGDVQRLVGETLKSPTNWKEELRHFFETSLASPDYTWSRPNMRYMHTGFFFPGMVGSTVPAIVIVRDTSGSIGGKYLQLMNGELLDIIETIKPEAVYVLDVDAAIQRVQTIFTGDDEEFEAKAKGGGGTDFRPPFKWVEDEGIDCTCFIYLTDLEGTFPTVAPDYPVLWAVPEGTRRGIKPPFGDYIELELP
jgi:predicted metal-dependent peptidase